MSHTNMKKENLQINNEFLHVIKELFTDDNIIWRDSYYGGRRFSFKVSNEFNQKYPTLFKRYRFDAVISYYITFIARCNPIPQEFIDKYNIQDGHIRLIKRSYFDLDL